MEKKTLGILGLVGGVVALAGLFLDWVSVSAMGMSIGASGWLILTTVGGIQPILVLVGSLLAALGGIGILMDQKMLSMMLPVGGIIAVAGAGWVIADMSSVAGAVGGTGIGVSMGMGIYANIIGGIIALIIGVMALKSE